MKITCLDTFDDFAIIVNDSGRVYLASTASFVDKYKYSNWRYI